MVRELRQRSLTFSLARDLVARGASPGLARLWLRSGWRWPPTARDVGEVRGLHEVARRLPWRGGLLAMRDGIWLVRRCGVLAEASEPPPLPIRLLEKHISPITSER
jgi:hypothetical protein